MLLMIENCNDILKRAFRKIGFDILRGEKTPQSFYYILVVVIGEKVKQEKDNLQWGIILENLICNKESIEIDLLDLDGLTQLKNSGLVITEYDFIKYATTKSEKCREIFSLIESRNREFNPEINTSTLSRYSTNMNLSEGLILVGRESEISVLEEVMLRKSKSNAILIGEAGVGKTAIVEGLAHNIFLDKCSSIIKDKIILQLSIAEIISGTRYRGDFEERMILILDELVRSKGKYIVFIDEIHTIVGSGGGVGGIDAGNIIKPYLARGDITFIGATTLQEYTNTIVYDEALARRFYPIYVSELSLDQTKQVLYELKKFYIKHCNISIEDKLINYLLHMVNSEINFKKQPDKSIDILELVFSRAIRTKRDIDETIINSVVKEYVGNFLKIPNCKKGCRD